MGQGTSVRTTCVTFQVAEETAERVTMEVAHRVIFTLSREYVPWPTVEEQAEIARVWELEKNLRNVIGAIDSSKIRILPPPGPSNAAAAYHNNNNNNHDNKKNFSILLIAIVDNAGKF
ncbi:unnamed protein product, partial [Laminaria digitata]